MCKKSIAVYTFLIHFFKITLFKFYTNSKLTWFFIFKKKNLQ